NSDYLWKYLMQRDYNISHGTKSDYITLYKFYKLYHRFNMSDINYVLLAASRNGHTEVVRLLLRDSRIDNSDKLYYAIKCASEIGYTDIVRLLLQDGRVDPSVNNNELIVYANGRNNSDIVKLLLQDSR